MYPVCFGGSSAAGADPLSTPRLTMVPASGPGRLCCCTAAQLGNRGSRSGMRRRLPTLGVAALAVPIAAGSLGA